MDYSKLSDFEINSAVARSFGLADFLFFKVDEEICSRPVWEVGSGSAYNGVRCSKGNPFDPCNNPADAWPIIIDNKIGVVPSHYDGMWFSSNSGRGSCRHENPLRAAMTVFLMMKDAENGL